MSRITSPPTLRTISSSNRLRTPPSWRTEIAISENDSSVPTIQTTAAGTLEVRTGCDGSGVPRASDSTGVTTAILVIRYSASGWFSGRALSKAASFWHAASAAASLGYFAMSTLKRRALNTCGTRQMSASVTCAPNA